MITKEITNSLFIIFIIFLVTVSSIESQTYNSKETSNSKKINLCLNIEQGKSYNHPTFAIWLENIEGKFLKSLFVTDAIGSGTWPYGIKKPGQWTEESGSRPRPMTLPYWLHKRNNNTSLPKIPSPKQPVPDAITGATPKNDFQVDFTISSAIPDTFQLRLEINQPWDWNQYWSSDKYTENEKYRISCQPAVVYSVKIDLTDKMDTYYLNPIGHSHFSGDNGYLYTNLSTLTTALNIIKTAKVKIQR